MSIRTLLPLLVAAVSVAGAPLPASAEPRPSTGPQEMRITRPGAWAKSPEERIGELARQSERLKQRRPLARIVPAPTPPLAPRQFYAPAPVTTPRSQWIKKRENTNVWHYLIPLGDR